MFCCFTKGDNFCNFLFAFLDDETKHFQGKIYSIRKELAPSSLRIDSFNPIALRMAKILRSFGHSECKRVKKESKNENGRVVALKVYLVTLSRCSFKYGKNWLSNSFLARLYKFIGKASVLILW